MLLGQAPQLPFPATQIVPGNEVHDFGTYNFPIPQAGPEAIGHLRTIASMLAQVITNSAKNGPVTCFAYNLFSNSHWNNNPWLSIVADTYDFAVRIQTTNPQADINQVIRTAVYKYGTYAISACVEKFPNLSQLLNQQQYAMVLNEINTFRNESSRVSALVAQIQNRTGSNSVVDPGNMVQNTMGSGIVGGLGMMDMEGAQSDIGSEGWVAPDARPMSKKQREKYNKQQAEIKAKEQLLSDEISATLRNGADHYDSLRVKSEIVEPDQPTISGLTYLTPPRPARKARKAVQVTEAVSEESVVEQPPVGQDSILLANEPDPVNFLATGFPETIVSETNDDLSTEEYESGRRVFIPFNLSSIEDVLDETGEWVEGTNYEISYLINNEDGSFGTWIATDGAVVKVVGPNTLGWDFRLGQLTRTAYNPFQWHRVFVQPTSFDGNITGNIIEGFIRVEDGDPMEYLDLELDPGVRARKFAELNADKRFIPLAGNVGTITHNPAGFGFRNKSAFSKAAAESNVPTVRQCDLGKDLVRAEDAADALIACTTYSPRSSVAIYCKVFGGINGRNVPITAIIDGVEDRVVDSVFDLISLITELRVKSPLLAIRVNEFVTRDVNIILQYGFGMESSSIDSFCDDYEELMELVTTTYGNESGEYLKNALDDYIQTFTGIDDNAYGPVSNMFYLQGDLLDYGVVLISSKSGFINMSKCEVLTRVIELGIAEDPFPDSFYLLSGDGALYRCIRSVWDNYHYTVIRV